VPTIYQRRSFWWARFALPTLRTGARNDDVKAMYAINWHDGQITSDFQKLCQAGESKIFRFRSHANQSHNSACLTADEGRSRSSRTRGEMRWTLRAR
jgi:hypothetical protein